MDSEMLLITYYCEHNHPWPASRNTHHNNHRATAVAAVTTTTNAATTSVSEEEAEEEEEEEEDIKPTVNLSINHPQIDFKFTNLGEGPSLEFGWFSDFESTTSSCTMLESPISTEDRITTDNEMAMIFTMREEDESLFADLGELPECSIVFRRGMAQREAAERPSLATTS